MLSVTQKINSDAKKTYRKVNSMFPENLPYIETQEAMQAYKKLMFHFGKKQIYDKRRGWITKRPHYNKKPRKCWVCLSGNSNTLSRGWRRLVHDVSHYIHDWRFPNSSRDHNIAQAKIEHEMAQFVIDSGWLNGILKPKPKPKPTQDEKRYAKINNLVKLIKSWEKKESIAKTYIQKYRKKLKRLRPTMKLDDLII
tara:strand:+ start:727 stop:1314 length:588 start_codon:yes stop_codon:yes gene_type:complete